MNLTRLFLGPSRTFLGVLQNCPFFTKKRIFLRNHAFFHEKTLIFRLLRGLSLLQAFRLDDMAGHPWRPKSTSDPFFPVISGFFCRFLQNYVISLEFLGHAWTRTERNWVEPQFGRRGKTPCKRIDKLFKPNWPP